MQVGCAARRAGTVRPARARGAKHEVVHRAAVAKAHLEFGRVRIDVHQPRIDAPDTARSWDSGHGRARRDSPAARHCSSSRSRTARPFTNQNCRSGLRARGGGQADPASCSCTARRTARSRSAVGAEIRRRARASSARVALSRILTPPGKSSTCRPLCRSANAHRERRQRQALHRAAAMWPNSVARTAHELAACRHVVEQIAHLDAGAGRVCRGLEPAPPCRPRRDSSPALSAASARREHDAQARRPRRSRAAPRRGSRSWRPPRDPPGWRSCWWHGAASASGSSCGAHAAAVVTHADQAEAAAARCRHRCAARRHRARSRRVP